MPLVMNYDFMRKNQVVEETHELAKHRNNKIAVLIPCYNEEVTIHKVVSDFKRELPKLISTFMTTTHPTIPPNSQKTLAPSLGSSLVRARAMWFAKCSEISMPTATSW